MRNYLYIILFLLLGTSSIAAQEPVTTINGHTFHVGDSLTIGLPYQPEEQYQNEPSKRYKTPLDIHHGKIGRFQPSREENSSGVFLPLRETSLEISSRKTLCTS